MKFRRETLADTSAAHSERKIRLPEPYDIPQKSHPLFLGLLFLSCVLLVVCYTNLFILYAFLKGLFGNTFITAAPVVILLLLCWQLTVLAHRLKELNRQQFSREWLLTGAFLLIIGLLLPTPELGVKRIHVAEYLLLSLLVRYTLSHRLTGRALFLYTALFSSILGIHDEFLQGLHPARTYGLPDMLVNGVSCLGGASIGHGLHLFSPPLTMRRPKCRELEQGLFLFWLSLSLLCFVIPVGHYLHSPIPYWTMLPLLASFTVFTCLRHLFTAEIRFALTTVTLASCSLLLYPVLINGLSLSFY